MREKKGSVRGKEEVDRIRVFVRIRPLNDEELRRGEAVGFEAIKERSEIVVNDGKEKRFNFDGIFTGSASNRQVFKEIGKPLVDAAFRGYNGTLMAYGQTGTGKTYTQMSHGGVCMLSVQKLFKRIQNDSQHDYKVYMSYLQIYQEKIFDLMNPDHKLEMVLREDPKKGVHVENLTEYVVRSADEVMSLIRSGKKRLIFAETRMNRLSSRSHSVCQITVERSIAREGVQRSASTVSNSNTVAAQPRRRHSSHDNPDAIASKIPMPKFGITRAHALPDHVTSGSKIPTPPRRGSHDGQKNFHNFIPHQASTPNLRTTDGLRTPSDSRFSSVSSLPELPSAIKPRPNRLSFHELSRSLSGSMESDMMSLDSDMLGSEAESAESLKSPVGISGIFEDDSDIFDEEEDDEEAFLQSIKIRDDVVTRGRINICDLAGSERVKRAQVDGERLSELQHINLSLLELGNTIHALSEGNRTHIPYRNSSLTRLLQDSLGGNCKTVFVLCVSPTRMDLSETRCTLEFGLRALKIKNTTFVNMEVDFVKLAADLRKKLEAQELEIQSQKECYEKQMQELQNDQLAKIAEKDSLLEHEKDEAKEEAEKLKAENENLKKQLEEESNRKSFLEQEKLEFLENSVREEQEKSEKLKEHQREIERLKQELKEEKRKSLLLEERAKVDLENLLEAERQEATKRQLLERERFEAELNEERQRVIEQRRQAERVYRDACCQSPNEDMIDIGLEQTVISETASTETLYNVLLAEIMSLQLLYQMQDIADVCNGALPRSTDSGWADYDDDLLENVGMNLLEKGGLILDTLRSNGDMTSHMTSTDSLRDVFLFQLPSSPKISCNTDEQSNTSILRISRDLSNEFNRKNPIVEQLNDASSSTMGSKISSEYSIDENNKNLESGTSSSMSSYCDQEPLSPRARRQPSDSGCSTQHSETPVESPVEQRPKLHKEFSSKGLGSNVCVPLAEEDDEDLFNDMEDTEQEQSMEILKNKVSKLDLELMRLKNELDRETVNFFSAVFLVDLSSYVEEDSPRVMRYLFDCVRDKLSAEIANKSDNKEVNDLELPLSVLEQAVNLLLVNKTVLSCILVLQNRARVNERQREDTLTSLDLSTTLEPKEELKIDQEVQTEEPSRSFKQQKRRGLLSFASKRRHSNQDAGTCTEPATPVRHSQCQTSDDWTTSSSPILSGNQASGTTSSNQEDPWSKQFEEALTSDDTFFSENLSRGLSRKPDGASVVDGLGTVTSGEESLILKNQQGEDQIPSEDEEDEKQKKKKMNLLSCLGPKARISFRKKKNSKAPLEKKDKLSKKK